MTFELLKNEERLEWFCTCFPELPFLDILLIENAAHWFLLKIQLTDKVSQKETMRPLQHH